jgi:6-phosphogluconolactonase
MNAGAQMSHKLGLRTRVAWAIFAFFILASTIVSRAIAAPAAGSSFVYVASSSDRPSRGIYAYRFDSKTGKLTAIGRVADVVSPGFLATDPHHRFLYVASDMDQDPKKTGFLSSYSINSKTGALTLLNKADLDGGPCHLVVDNTGRIIFAANYGNGTVASFALKSDGSIGQKTGFDQHTGKGPNAERQEGPHAHAVVISPDNRFLFVPDLGADQIKIYKIDVAKRTFTPNDPPFASVNPGLGPRHFVFGRGAKFAYVVCEMGSSVVAFAYDPVKGSLTPLQTISTLPAGFKGIDNSAEIDIGRTGRFLYASNRGHDSLTVFAIDPNKGTLTKVQVAPSLGKIPRNFALDPTGRFLLAGNQESDQLVVFAVDQTSGELTPAGQVVDVPAPDCILFVPSE